MAAGAALVLAGCGGAGGTNKDAAGARRPAALAPAETVAEVAGQPITAAELDERAAGGLVSLRQKEYNTRRQTLDRMISERLLGQEARARGVSVEELLRREVEQKVPRPTDAEVAAFYQEVAHRVGGRTLEEVRPDLTAALQQRAADARRRAFERELRDRAKVRVLLPVPRMDVPVPANAPRLGPAEAPITIVEYLDYQCPYCQRAQATVDALLARYPDKLRFVYRDFPIEGHPGAMPAAKASRCAGDQGKFWELHRALLARPSDFSPAELRARAAQVGLDVGAFEGCLASNRHEREIREAYDSGSRLGVESTPTFFVNGRMVVGARPLEAFQEVIDEELAGGGSRGH